MRFTFYQLRYDDDGTGDGSRVDFCPTLRAARTRAREVAEEERAKDEEYNIPTSPLTTITVQEITLAGTPTEIAAAALVAAGSANEATWLGHRGDILRGRRWNVSARGTLIPTT